jgi:hypothetical protein
MNTITVYKWVNGCRVVRGEHRPHRGADKHTVCVYDDAPLAYGLESRRDVHAALLRIDPDLDQRVACPPLLEIPLELSARPTGEIYGIGGYRDHAATRVLQTPDQVVQHAGVDFFERNR